MSIENQDEHDFGAFLVVTRQADAKWDRYSNYHLYIHFVRSFVWKVQNLGLPKNTELRISICIISMIKIAITVT